MTLEEELALIHKKPASGPVADAMPPTDAQAPVVDTATPPVTGPKTHEQIDAEFDLPAPDTTPRALPEVQPTWDVLGAAWSASTIKSDAWAYAERKRKAIVSDVFAKLDPETQARVRAGMTGPHADHTKFTSLVLSEAEAAAKTKPADWGDLPFTQDALNERVLTERQAELKDAQAVLDQPGGGIAEFIGSTARELTRPVNVITAPIGGGTLTGWKFLLAEFGAGAFSSAVVLPGEISTADELGIQRPDATTAILLGGLTQAGLSGVLAAGAKYIPKAYRKIYGQKAAHHDSIAAITPDGGDKLSTEIEIDREEAKLRGEEGAKVDLAEDGTLPSIVANNQGPAAVSVIEAGKGYTVIALPDGTAVRREGTRAWRNNNPGNIEYGNFARSAGAVGTDGRFAVFPTYEAGRKAKARLLWGSKGYRGMTIGEAIARYAPSSENDTRAYTSAITRATATKSDTLMSALTPQQRQMMMDAMERVEGFRPGTENGVQATAPRKGISSPSAGEDAPAYGGNTSRGYTGEGQVAVGDNTKIDVEYVVVDLDSLTRASGDLQPRDRSRGTSDAWIADTAARLDPAQLMPSPTADRGAPIVGPDSVIESGNGRVGAIARAYEYHPDRASAYRAQIEAAGYAVPEGVKRPVLVAKRKTELTQDQRRQMVIDAQDSGVAVMTPTEIARTSSRAMTAPVLGRLDPSQPLTAEANGDFVRAALAGLPRSARNAMFDAGGMLNASGQRQLREAMFARAWNDPDIIEMFTEADQGELKSLMEALATAAPNWAALKADIEAGLVRPEMDISGHVLDAMRLIASARKLASRDGLSIGKALAELLDDVDLIQGVVAPLTTALVRKFWKNGRAASADDVAGFLARYADDARKAGSTADMFGATTPRDVLRAIDKDAFANLPENLGPVRGFARPSQQTLPHEGYDAGANSPEVEIEDAAVRDALEAPATDPGFQRLQPDAVVKGLRADLAKTAADLGDLLDTLKFEMPDKTTTSFREFLNDLDRDTRAIDILNGCAISPGGA